VTQSVRASALDLALDPAITTTTMYSTGSSSNLANPPMWGKLLSLSENIAAIPSIELRQTPIALGRNKTCHASCAGWPDTKKYSSKHCEIFLEADESGDYAPFIVDHRYDPLDDDDAMALMRSMCWGISRTAPTVPL